MPRARCTFRQRDVTAALKAAVAAGVTVHSVKITAEGNIEVVIGRTSAQDFSTADRNEWDEDISGGRVALTHANDRRRFAAWTLAPSESPLFSPVPSGSESNTSSYRGSGQTVCDRTSDRKYRSA
jgi:hypothetical protein